MFLLYCCKFRRWFVERFKILFFFLKCKNNLDGVPFTVDSTNKIHCIECFHSKYAPRCHICRLPITPERGQEETTRIVALDKSFHIACYKCEVSISLIINLFFYFIRLFCFERIVVFHYRLVLNVLVVVTH